MFEFLDQSNAQHGPVAPKSEGIIVTDEMALNEKLLQSSTASASIAHIESTTQTSQLAADDPGPSHLRLILAQSHAPRPSGQIVETEVPRRPVSRRPDDEASIHVESLWQLRTAMSQGS